MRHMAALPSKRVVSQCPSMGESLAIFKFRVSVEAGGHGENYEPLGGVRAESKFIEKCHEPKASLRSNQQAGFQYSFLCFRRCLSVLAVSFAGSSIIGVFLYTALRQVGLSLRSTLLSLMIMPYCQAFR